MQGAAGFEERTQVRMALRFSSWIMGQLWGGWRQTRSRMLGECKWTGGQAGGSSPPAVEWKNREGADLGEKNRVLVWVSWIRGVCEGSQCIGRYQSGMGCEAPEKGWAGRSQGSCLCSM